MSLFALHCLESLNVEQCFGSCGKPTKKKKKSKPKKKQVESDDDDDDDDASSSSSSSDSDNEKKIKSRPATAKRRFSSVPQAVVETSLGNYAVVRRPEPQPSPKSVGVTPRYYGVTMQPKNRHEHSQVVSIRRKKYHHYQGSTDTESSTSASVKRFRTRSWDPNTWTAKAPHLPIDFGIKSGDLSLCVVDMSKVVAHVSGDGFTGMLRHPDGDLHGHTISQMFTARFADLLSMMFDTSTTKSSASIICIVCDNIPRNIVSYPLFAKGKMEGLLFVWHDSLPQQELEQMIVIA